MSTMPQHGQIVNGAEVFGADGGKVGAVAAVYPGYVVVEKGFFFPTDYFIPRSAVASADGGEVYLNIGKDAALDRGWDIEPADLETASFADVGRPQAGIGVTPAEAMRDDMLGSSTQILDEEEIHIPVVEEELTATVRPQEAGAVRIEKDVVTEERTLDVPVTEERVRIEHRVVDRPVAGEDEVLEDSVIEAPLRTEEVHVDEDEVIDPSLIEGSEGGTSRAI